MARSRTRGAAQGAATKTKVRAARSTSKKVVVAPAAAAEVEIVEEDRGLSAEDGIAIVTFLILLTAILILDYGVAQHYGSGSGFFF